MRPGVNFGTPTVSCRADCPGSGSTLSGVPALCVSVSAARCDTSENPSATWVGGPTILPSAGVELRRCECALTVALVTVNNIATPNPGLVHLYRTPYPTRIAGRTRFLHVSRRDTDGDR